MACAASIPSRRCCGRSPPSPRGSRPAAPPSPARSTACGIASRRETLAQPVRIVPIDAVYASSRQRKVSGEAWRRSPPIEGRESVQYVQSVDGGVHGGGQSSTCIHVVLRPRPLLQTVNLKSPNGHLLFLSRKPWGGAREIGENEEGKEGYEDGCSSLRRLVRAWRWLFCIGVSAKI